MIGNQGIAIVPQYKSKLVLLRNDSVKCKALSEDPLGAYALFEVKVPPQSGLPSYIHHWEDHAYYILAGELSIQEGDRTFFATAGAFVNIPKGISHTFKNVGTAPAKLLAIVTPAWYGKFFKMWANQQQITQFRRLRLGYKTGKMRSDRLEMLHHNLE